MKYCKIKYLLLIFNFFYNLSITMLKYLKYFQITKCKLFVLQDELNKKEK